MKTVQEIVAKIETISIMGDTSISIHELKLDSRKVSNGDVFFAIKGTTVDGHAFIDNVIKLGARVIVCETLPSEIKTDIVYIHVKDARKTCALMACNFFQNPSK